MPKNAGYRTDSEIYTVKQQAHSALSALIMSLTPIEKGVVKLIYNT
jgi:hypothetical protein